MDPEDEEVFKYITHAYTTLTNEDSRRAYDKTMAPDLPDWDKNSEDETNLFAEKKRGMSTDAMRPVTPAVRDNAAFQNQMTRLQALRNANQKPPSAGDSVPQKPAKMNANSGVQNSKQAEATNALNNHQIRPIILVFCGLVLLGFILIAVILLHSHHR